MKKAQAIELLGGTPKKAQVAMGYRAIQTIYQWPDELPQGTADRVRGAVERMGKGLKSISPRNTAQELSHVDA